MTDWCGPEGERARFFSTDAQLPNRRVSGTCRDAPLALYVWAYVSTTKGFDRGGTIQKLAAGLAPTGLEKP
ncbi:hypothetical protein YTPLAS18_19910 [Nitrospira sp.]|nr:hypothetical protein YTPLAS18_19910 [Nitrospira sp.]